LPRGTYMNILLIDDKKDILDTMGEILEICQNHKVQGASSGKEALKWIRKKKYDLVITELALRVMNGVEVISKIRKLQPEIQIVVLTGIKCNDSLREKLEQAGVKRIFQKPKGIQELLLYLKRKGSKHSAA
jgi:CheY-like chemotaxis protein